MRKELKNYARKILADHGCDLYTYGTTEGEQIMDDLKEGYPDGMDYPYIDVANAIIAISKRKPVTRSTWHVIYDMDDCIDGYDTTSLAQGKSDVLDTFLQWMYNEQSLWKNGKPTKRQIEQYDNMIEVFNCYVAKYNPMTDEYDDYWYPSDDDLRRIGWMPWKEMEAMLNA